MFFLHAYAYYFFVLRAKKRGMSYNDLINLVLKPMDDKEATNFSMESITQPLRIPVPPKTHKELVSERDIDNCRPITQLFIKDNKAEHNDFPKDLKPALSITSVTAFSNMSESTVKLNWHRLLITKLFCLVSYMFPGCQVAEDVTEEHTGSMTTPRLRRDLYIWINDFLVFFGEAKREVKDLKKEKDELLDKTTQDFIKDELSQTLPYVFGIVVARNIGQFFVYHLKDSRIEVIKWGEQDLFDFNVVLDRVPIVTIFINILRWMRWAMSRLQDTRHHEIIKDCIFLGGTTVVRENDDHFMKIFNVPQAHEERLRKIYYHLLSGHFNNAAQYKVYINDIEVDAMNIQKVAGIDQKFRLEVRPKGRMEIPNTPGSLFTAVTDLLAYLDSLHSKHMVHRDLRWPNIPFDSKSGHYFVIDHETASCNKELLFWRPGHPDFFDPEVQAGKQPYEFADDVFQLGALIIRAIQVRMDRGAWTPEQVALWLEVAEACRASRATVVKVRNMLEMNELQLK